MTFLAVAVSAMGITTTLVSVCNPVTVTAGKSVVVNGTVCSIVIDRTPDWLVLFDVEGAVGRAVTVMVLASGVNVATGSVTVTVLVRVPTALGVNKPCDAVGTVVAGATGVGSTQMVTVVEFRNSGAGLLVN